ncbi:MAG: hypothetical protein VX210_14310 [Myxococcota bacterium]|nr:hypothetical protein [Myxococcota bacterium]
MRGLSSSWLSTLLMIGLLSVSACSSDGEDTDTEPQTVDACGNSVLDGIETCDDGNTTGGDGCSTSCQVEAGYQCDDALPSTCVDIDECKARPCSHGGICINEPGSYQCDCSGTNYTGPTCDDLVDDAPALAECRGRVETVGDGYCDLLNNVESCNFDGGDCCGSTCTDSTFMCGGYVHATGAEIGEPNFNCLDPSACENTELGCYECAPGCDPSLIGDGVCQAECWNAACEWDSSAQGVGDCSCPDLGLYTDCDGQCFDDSYLGWVGDGYCDDGTYGLNLVCADWTNDLDDCEDGAWEPPLCPGYESEIADGYCDAYNNNPECDYDGGDCCASECFSDAYPCPYDLGLYDCQDPNAGENDGSLSCDASLCDGSQIGDGTCQVDCWTPECGWDSNQSGVSDCSCEELNAALGEPGFEFVADCNGQCYYGFFFDRWMGDGFCDQGEYGLSLNCEAHQFDQGDCE